MAQGLRAKDVVALCGELGSGKTCLVKGIAEGLGIPQGEVVSPSFTLVNEYPGPLPLYHIDFYRLQKVEELTEIGYWEYLGREGVVVIEWADRLPQAIPPSSLWVRLSFWGEKKRKISLQAEGEMWERIRKKI